MRDLTSVEFSYKNTLVTAVVCCTNVVSGSLSSESKRIEYNI